MLFKCHNCLTLQVEPKVSGTHYRCGYGTMHKFENIRHLFVTGKVNLNDLAMFKKLAPTPTAQLRET